MSGVHRYSKTQSTWSLLSDYRVSLEPTLLLLHSPSYDAPPPSPKKKRGADRVPGAFLLGSAHICWLTPHHRAALKPSERAEALAPSVFNGRWLGHEKSDAGGSGLTFLREHHENCSNKIADLDLHIQGGRRVSSQTLNSAERMQTSSLDTLSPLLSDRIHIAPHTVYNTDFSLGYILFISFYSDQSQNAKDKTVSCT